MSKFRELHFVESETKAAEILSALTPKGKTFLDIPYDKPSEYVNYYWDQYQKSGKGVNSLNGKVFELIIATLLYRENLRPLYIQAKVAFVPNVDFDALLYSKECGPISFSMKTSLRERYKQADLEAIALKYVHRKAKAFILTMDKAESANLKAKITNGDVIGLDKVILCSGSDMDNLIKELHAYEFSLAGTVDIIQSTQVVM